MFVSRHNPPLVPVDTSLEAWLVQMAAIRAMTVAQRIEQWEALNTALAEMEAAAFERRFPDLSPRHRFLVRMRVRYGVDLATEVWPELAEVSA